MAKETTNAGDITMQFKKSKDTKNTVKYEEVVGESEAPNIGTLYVQKHAAKGREELTVIIKG